MKYNKKQSGMLIYNYRFYLDNVPDWAKNPLLDQINGAINVIANRTIDNQSRGPMVFFNSDKELLSSDVGSWVY